MWGVYNWVLKNCSTFTPNLAIHGYNDIKLMIDSIKFIRS